jgi:THO complex subunit 3
MAAATVAAPPLFPTEPTAAELRLIAAPVRLLCGHTAKVTKVAWSADGSCLASASDDATIRLWRFEGAPPLPVGEPKVLRAHTGPVDAIAWSPTEKHVLASAAADGTLRLWDTRELGRVDALLSVSKDVDTLAWKPDGSTLAMGTRSDELLLIDVRGGRPAVLGKTQFALQLNKIAWTPSGLLFCMCVQRTAPLEEGHLVVCKVNDDGKGVSPILQRLAHTMAANAIAFDKTFRFFATGGSDSIVALWDAVDVTCIRTFDRNETIIRDVSFSHDAAFLSAASDDKALEIVRQGCYKGCDGGLCTLPPRR